MREGMFKHCFAVDLHGRRHRSIRRRAGGSHGPPSRAEPHPPLDRQRWNPLYTLNNLLFNFHCSSDILIQGSWRSLNYPPTKRWPTLPSRKISKTNIDIASEEIDGWKTTLPETNIAPENGWLEILVSFWDGQISGAMLALGIVPSFLGSPIFRVLRGYSSKIAFLFKYLSRRCEKNPNTYSRSVWLEDQGKKCQLYKFTPKNLLLSMKSCLFIILTT